MDHENDDDPVDGKVPTRFVLTGYSGDAVLVCPICACDNVHINGVAVHQNKTSTVITNDTTRVVGSKDADEPSFRRGSIVNLMFSCESGCGFRYTFRFHKGAVLVDLESCPDMADAPELWRD